MAKRSRSRRRLFWIGVVLVVLVVCVAVIALEEAGAAQERSEQRAHIVSLLAVGMTEADVTRVLDQQGIPHNPIVQPTSDDTHFEIAIPIFERFDRLGTIDYVVTGGSVLASSGNSWVIVVLDETGVVTAIE